MRNSLFALATLVAAFTAPLSAQLVDFETTAAGSFPSLTYTAGSVGVTLTRPGMSPIRVSDMALAPYAPGVFGGTAIDTALTAPFGGIWATFSTPVQAVSIDFSDYSGPKFSPNGEDDTAYLYAYGSSGELLASASSFLPGDSGIFSQEFGRVYVAASQIASVRFTSTNFGSQPSDSLYWDNLRINQAALSSGLFSLTAPVPPSSAVPEPSTYAAFGTVLLLGAIWQRRRTKA